MNKKGKEVTLQGIIVANDFDSSGNPVRFALLTNNEKKYLIDTVDLSSGKLLAEYNRKKVILCGVQEVIDYTNVIVAKKVKDYDDTGSDILDIL